MYRDQLKRYFYRMKITSYDGQHVLELPPSILRLMADVTISESSYSDADATYPTLNIVFHESHSSPAPGSILDLRFDTEKGFTYITKQELESGVTRSKRNTAAKPEPVVFLFQGNNYLEIEWGLLEPAKVSRTRKFQITTVNMQGGPNGDGTATITALDGRLTADKTNLINGKVFANPATLVPNSLKQTLFQVCAALDYDLEFDGVRVTDFPNEFTKYVQARTDAGGDTAPADGKPFVFPRQMSIHEFVVDLANKYGSSYEYDTDQNTGRTVLKFTYRDSRFRNTDFQFTYKSRDGLITSYKIDSLEGSFNPTTGVSTSVEGGELQATTEVQIAINDNKLNGKQDTTKIKVPQASDPNASARVKNKLGAESVGASETIPGKSKEAIDNHMAHLYNGGKYISMLTLTTLGHPNYKPSLIQLSNVGVRYSKQYRMFTVQHKLNAAGYLCTWSGKSHYAGEGGIDPDDGSKANQDVTEVQLVKNQ